MTILKNGRKGFALVTVVVVAAILGACSLIFAVQLRTERTVTGNDAVFREALNVAEEGLDTAISMIRNDVVDPGDPSWGSCFSAAQQVDLGARLSSVPRGVYAVQVSAPVNTETVSDSGEGSNPWTQVFKGTVTITSTGRMFNPSATGDLTALMDGWTARRAVSAAVQVQWQKVRTSSTDTTPGPPNTFPVKYGVFAGGNLTIKGSSQEIHGDVFANGSIDVQKSNGIVGGVAYAHGTVTGAAPAGSTGGVAAIPFPTLNMPYFQVMFNAYVNGTFPYDGSKAGYTNTNPSTPEGQANRTKYDISGLIANPANYALYKDPSAVYYVNGPLTISSNAELHGTIAVNGDFTIHGSTDITHGTGALPAIVVNGNIIKENGNSSVTGIMLCSGTFSGNGSATITGSLMCGGTVEMNGNLTITYDGTQGTIDTGGSVTTTTTPGTPTYAVLDVAQPLGQAGSWKEVQPQ